MERHLSNNLREKRLQNIFINVLQDCHVQVQTKYLKYSVGFTEMKESISKSYYCFVFFSHK